MTFGAVTLDKKPSDEKEARAVAFRAIKSRGQLASLLDIKLQRLAFYVYRHPTPYREFLIRKRNGSPRAISAPTRGLKEIQRRLSRYLYSVYRTRVCVHGYATDRSIVTNAKTHLAQRYVLKFDLADFFGTIHVGRVIGLFEKVFHFDNSTATFLAQICCRTGSLPQGAPTSPILSNLLCWNLDNKLLRLAKTHRCRYSRYADDITISTNQARFPKDIATLTEIDGVSALSLGSAVTQLVAECGFSVNDSKTRLMTKKQRQEVSGVIVNDKMNVDRRFVRNIRAALYNWQKLGTEEAQRQYELKHRGSSNPARPPPGLENLLRGRIEHVAYVRGKRDQVYAGLATRFNFLAKKKLLIPATAFDAFTESLRAAVWVIAYDDDLPPDTVIDDDDCLGGTAFYLDSVGWVTCSHCVRSKGVDRSSRKVLFRPSQPNKRYKFKIERYHDTVDLAVLSAEIPTTDHGALTISPVPSATHGYPLQVVGWPEFGPSDDITIIDCRVTGSRIVSSIRRVRVSAHIIGGNSGGPALDSDGRVVGVVVTGGISAAAAADTINHGLIPISALKHLDN